MKKKEIFVFIFALIFSLNLISAINLNVETKSISNAVITDLNEPAVFELKITNLDDTSNFEIFSLVGVDISSAELPLLIEKGKAETVRINVMPQESIKTSNKGFFTFEYLIKDSKGGTQKETLTINIVDLSTSFSIIPENINPMTQQMVVSVKNKAQHDFDNLILKMSSVFLDYDAEISLKASETKQILIPLDKEKLKELTAGHYLLSTRIQYNKKFGNTESIIRYLEQEGIETTETEDGTIINRHEIIKRNLGNVKNTVQINIEKDIFSYLFTTFNIAPTESKITGFKKYYTWEKELVPNEEMDLVVKTNWLYPFFVLILAIVLFVFIKRSVEADVSLKKNVSFVKTKGGQFALKVSVRVKAKKYIEKINIIDKLPHLVNLYEKFGAVAPDKVDVKNKRLEWNVEALNEGEERIFSYIIYSKIGVVGRFELPSAEIVYEKDGRVKKEISNRSFFVNNPPKKKY